MRRKVKPEVMTPRIIAPVMRPTPPVSEVPPMTVGRSHPVRTSRPCRPAPSEHVLRYHTGQPRQHAGDRIDFDRMRFDIDARLL